MQIDTINVIERCHHHILYSRIPAYRRADLKQAQSIDKSVFEYWTHALSYVPAKDFRFFVPLMREHKREGHRWYASVASADLRKVMRLIKRDGALTIRDIEDDVLHGEGASVGEPQAVEARAAACLLHRRADDQRAQRHAEDL